MKVYAVYFIFFKIKIPCFVTEQPYNSTFIHMDAVKLSTCILITDAMMVSSKEWKLEAVAGSSVKI